MSEIFSELPKKRRMAIVNAGLEVFSKFEYKRASTEEIAIKAGISKGLLFYYFHNKMSLYMFLLDYCNDLLKKQSEIMKLEDITDFFEYIGKAVELKTILLEKNPYIMDFTMRAYYSQNEIISEKLQNKIQKDMNDQYSTHFKKVDYSKFREEADPEEIYQMLIWMTDGYLHEKQRRSEAINVVSVKKELDKWIDKLKRISYKEEYL